MKFKKFEFVKMSVMMYSIYLAGIGSGKNNWGATWFWVFVFILFLFFVNPTEKEGYR